MKTETVSAIDIVDDVPDVADPKKKGFDIPDSKPDIPPVEKIPVSPPADAPPDSPSEPAKEGTPPAPPDGGQGEVFPKKRGRPKGSRNRPRADFSDIDGENFESKKPVDYNLMSNAIFASATGTLSVVLGPEWQPRVSPEGVSEKEMVVAPLAKYLETKNVEDISPGWLLIIAIVGYSTPRVFAPSTKSKLGKLAGFFGRFFKRKKGIQKMDVTKPDVDVGKSDDGK